MKFFELGFCGYTLIDWLGIVTLSTKVANTERIYNG